VFRTNTLLTVRLQRFKADRRYMAACATAVLTVPQVLRINQKKETQVRWSMIDSKPFVASEPCSISRYPANICSKSFFTFNITSKSTLKTYILWVCRLRDYWTLPDIYIQLSAEPTFKAFFILQLFFTNHNFKPNKPLPLDTFT